MVSILIVIHISYVWNSNGYVGYRYNKLKESAEKVVNLDWEPIAYNDCLCPSKGDRAVYRTTDTVTIHIYDSNYDEIVLAQRANLLTSDSNNGSQQQYYGLQPGIYYMFLQKATKEDRKKCRLKLLRPT